MVWNIVIAVVLAFVAWGFTYGAGAAGEENDRHGRFLSMSLMAFVILAAAIATVLT